MDGQPPQPVWPATFPVPIGFARQRWNQSLRQTARISIDGERVRIVLSNAYGAQPLVIGAARVALARSSASIVAGSCWRSWASTLCSDDWPSGDHLHLQNDDYVAVAAMARDGRAC